jgi:hypothetical protein
MRRANRKLNVSVHESRKKAQGRTSSILKVAAKEAAENAKAKTSEEAAEARVGAP